MPKVSIIVPCYNEENTIGYLLDAICDQTYSLREIEVIISDGMSIDNTLDVINKFKDNHPNLNIIIVKNEKKNIPSGLNRAIESSNGDIIIRLDAHSIPAKDYVQLCINDLEKGLGNNIGGVWDIKPQSEKIVAKSIALSASHPIAVGDAKYRYTNKPAYVDTVPFGAFYKNYIIDIGAFDETLLTNEDYELNVRIRQNGGQVWLNPNIRSIYFARSNYIDLAKQYWRYGFWKLEMLKRYPETIRWRQALPPIFLTCVVFLFFLSIWYDIARFLIVAQLLLYISIIVLSTIPVTIKEKDIRYLVTIPIAIIVMHQSWAVGFLTSIFSKLFSRQ